VELELNASEAAKNINEAYGDGTSDARTARRWFAKFNSGEETLEDKPRSGRPTVLDEGDLQAALDAEPSSSTRELGTELGVSHMTVWNYLKQLDFVHKKPRQDPHELTEAQAAKRVEICRQLLNNPLNDRFWKRIVTCDEKWVFLVNPDRSKRWVPKGDNPTSVARLNRFDKKVMISVWWNVDGIVHFELVPEGKAVNAELYTEQLDRVYEAMRQKYPTLISRKRALLQQDNAPAHRAKKTQGKIAELDGIEVLPHPAYSPDLAPSDYGLFSLYETLFAWTPL